MKNCPLSQYEIMARATPSESTPNPKIYKHTVFAKNLIAARSHFWVDMKRVSKIKKTEGQIVSEKLIDDYDNAKIRNFGLHIRYKYKRRVYNAYVEQRALSTAAAVFKMHQETKSRHNIAPRSIVIAKCVEVKDEDVQKKRVKRFVEDDVEFAHPSANRLMEPKRLREVFVPKAMVEKMR